MPLPFYTQLEMTLQPRRDTTDPDQQRKQLIALAVVGVLATCALYWENLSWVSSHWTRAAYSHGPLVAGFSAWLLWSNRESFPWPQNLKRGFDGLMLGTALIAIGLLMRLAGIYTAILTLEALSFLPFLTGALVLACGKGLCRWAGPAIAFLVFMIPLPGFLSTAMSGSLQAIATKVSVFLLQLSGIPATVDGNVIYLSETSIGVAEACSGLRMLYTFIAITVGACLFGQRTLTEKIILLLSSIPIAILANCLRIWMTGLAFEYLDDGMTTHLSHDFLGFFMIFLGIGLVALELRLFQLMLIPEEQPRSKTGASHAT